MATLKQRLHRKNASGSYDIVHLETSASCVLMADGTTVEAAVNSKAASGHTHNYAASSHTHNKSQITDFPTSLPASDVYNWAKMSSKPSYAWSEITDKPSTFAPATHSHVAIYTATTKTTWTTSGNYYYQDVTVTGILATDSPIVDINPGSDNDVNIKYSENICKIFRIVTSDDKIRIWSTEKITSAIALQLKVVR